MEVAAGAVKGASTIYMGLESAAATLATSLTDNTVKVVTHRQHVAVLVVFVLMYFEKLSSDIIAVLMQPQFIVDVFLFILLPFVYFTFWLDINVFHHIISQITDYSLLSDVQTQCVVILDKSYCKVSDIRIKFITCNICQPHNHV